MIPVLGRYSWLRQVVVALIALCVSPGVALGQEPVAISIETSKGSMPQAVEYLLRVESGPDGAQFGLEYGLPKWPTMEPVFGSPLKVPSVEISGPGSLRSAPVLPPKPVLLFKKRCIRAIPDSFAQRFWIEMPANGVSTVHLLAKGTYPAWPGTTYGVKFSTFAINDPVAKLVPLASINVPRFVARGTRIEIEAKGHSRTGETPEIVGRTSPPLRSARVALRVVRPSRSGGVELKDWADAQSPAAYLGAVQTDHQGHFRVPPRPFSGIGSYAVIARSQARGERAADWNCGAFFKVQ